MIAALHSTLLYRTLIPALAVALLASGCGEQQSDSTQDAQVAVVKTFGELPYCWFGQRSAVFFVSSTEQFFYCDGRNYVELTMVGQAGPEGPQGEPGEDGMSCSVSDDGNGTVTIRCDDGTVAIVRDGAPGPAGPEGPQGPQGEPGEDGVSCAIAANGDGTVTISCGDDTVTITGGQDGSSCSAATDASGAVTIACDDGTSATIPAGGGDGGATVELLCDVVGENNLDAPRGLECPDYCPCFRATEILADAAVTGCRRFRDGQNSRVETLPLSSDGGYLPLDNPTGEFYAEVFGTINNFRCFGPDGRRLGDPIVLVSDRKPFLACESIIEDAVGPCILECQNTSDCRGRDPQCTDDVCEDGLCVNQNEPTGTVCFYDVDRQSFQGECFAGQCVPSLVIGVPGGAP